MSEHTLTRVWDKLNTLGNAIYNLRGEVAAMSLAIQRLEEAIIGPDPIGELTGELNDRFVRP